MSDGTDLKHNKVFICHPVRGETLPHQSSTYIFQDIQHFGKRWRSIVCKTASKSLVWKCKRILNYTKQKKSAGDCVRAGEYVNWRKDVKNSGDNNNSSLERLWFYLLSRPTALGDAQNKIVVQWCLTLDGSLLLPAGGSIAVAFHFYDRIISQYIRCIFCRFSIYLVTFHPC